ncbi:hypothetical protein [Methyloglobulus sp.]|uniref:hypothetical protein n=1 Tax=Methyloglobulus sp. TaxID=2518622 RepID=UPI0032B7238E
MKKLLLGAAISAAFFVGPANAAITLDGAGKPVITPADTYEVYLSGASAPVKFIEQLLTSAAVPAASRVCNPSFPIYKYKDNVSGSDQNAYLCVGNTANPTLAPLLAGAKKNLLIYKRSLGGSAQGVSPIIANSAINFLRVDVAANCSAPVIGGGLSTLTCAYTEGDLTVSKNVIPDFGVSDVDPIQFQGVNTPAGFAAVTAADLLKLNVKSAAAQVFGVVVNTKLRDALQQAQFPATNTCNPTNAGYAAVRESATCQPSLDSAQIASIFVGKLSSWTQLKLGAAGNLFASTTAPGIKPLNARVHICSRTNGSGTKAQFGVKFLNYPCTGSVGTPPKPDTGILPETVAQAQVHQMGSGGQLAECLSELDSGVNTIGTAFNNTYGARWAIGIQGTENNATNSSAYRTIRVDGVTPTLANVVNGKYKDWTELTFQTNKVHVFDAGELNIVNEIIKQAGNPAVMAATNPAALHTWGQAGFLAVPTSFAAPANGVINLASPVNPLSHAVSATVSANACRAPVLYNGTGGLQLN